MTEQEILEQVLAAERSAREMGPLAHRAPRSHATMEAWADAKVRRRQLAEEERLGFARATLKEADKAPDECLIFDGPLTTQGYPRNSLRKPLLELRLGRPLSPGHVVRSICGVRACVNPHHMTEGRRGGRITKQHADLIRAADKRGVDHAKLARICGVSERTIRHIVAGKTWA